MYCTVYSLLYGISSEEQGLRRMSKLDFCNVQRSPILIYHGQDFWGLVKLELLDQSRFRRRNLSERRPFSTCGH